MKRFATLLLSLILGPAAISQDFQFEVITPAEQQLTTLEKYPDAEAVVLFDLGKSMFYDTYDNGYNIQFTRTKRIKILKNTGIKYAQVSIPFYVDGFGKTESIRSIEAYTYNMDNGRLVKTALDQTTVYEEKINNHWKAKKFVFPSVKSGSIIEYKYILETPFHFNLPDWTFQDYIPTMHSQYTANMIPFYEYMFLAQGISKFDLQNSEKGSATRTFYGMEFNDMIYTFAMKDVPAFKDEGYITSPDDYLMKIDFQLAKFHSPSGGTTEIISTWPELTESLIKDEDFGKYVKNCRKYAKSILEERLNIEGKSSAEKAKLIINYVKSNFIWNGFYGKYANKKPKDFVEQKTGNVAEINLFLTALLNTAGIDAKPVLLSTRDHGKIKSDYPFLHFFNYLTVLVKDGTNSFLTDATEDLLAYDRIPPRCINDNGLIIDEGEVNWVKTNYNITSLDNKIISLDIDPEALTAKSSITIQSSEFESYLYKSKFNNDSIKLKEQWLNKGLSKISKISTLNYTDDDKVYIIAFKGEAPIEKIGNKIIISPFLKFPIQENKLTQKKRTYPVDFIYPKTENFKSLIKIPEGYKTTVVPEPFKMTNELADINIEYTSSGDVLEAKANYTLKKAIYEPHEYARIRYYFDQIVEKFNEQVVLEKI